MARDTIRYTPDGDGWWYEIRDERRVLVKQAWIPGDKRYARADAIRVRDNHRRRQREAA